jgi:hypothetical protein
MKKILTTLALLAALATPALANTVNHLSPAQTGGGSVGYNQSEHQAVVNR